MNVNVIHLTRSVMFGGSPLLLDGFDLMKAERQAVWAEFIPHFVVIALTALILQAAKTVLYAASGFASLSHLLAVSLIATLTWRINYDSLGLSYRVMVRGLALILGVYVVLAFPSFDANSHPHAAGLIRLYALIPWLGLIGGILAWFRPGFALVPAVCVLVGKSLTREILQLPSLSPTDYLPVVELLLFMSLGVMVARGLSLLHTRWSVSGRWLEGIHAHTFLPSLSQTLFIASVAVHFGNYFMSGVEKVLLDGGPMVWVTSNETPWLMEVAARGGFLPISSYTEFSEWVHGSMKSVYPLSNTLVLVSQLIAVVAILRTQWALWLTIFYDLTHVFIFVVSGIFFWKWILLNAIIVYGLARLRGIRLGVPLQVLCIGLVIAGNLTFFTARLGWYDTRGFVHHYFEAVTADGRLARVPSNFFLSGSVTVAQNRLGTSSPNHFPLGTWGNTKDNLIRQRAAQDCNFDDLLANRYVLDEKFLRNFVRRHSKFVIDRVDREGHFSFDWYPHHIFSSAAAHRSFYEIDLRDIVEYRYIVESVCLDGTLQSERDRVVHRDVINIEVP